MLLRRIFRQHALMLPLSVCLTIFGSAGFGSAQTAAASSPLITGPINETSLVTLTGNTHPLAQPKYDQGPVLDSMPMQHMYLLLRRSADQEKALTTLLTQLQTPKTSTYHKWLTAEELGKYGPAQADIATVVSWLTAHGMQVNGVSKSGMTVDVSGTAGQVREAFHTEIHNYSVAGKSYIANASDPQIPAALSPLVSGFNSLNSFFPKPLVQKRSPNFSFSVEGYQEYDESPVDLAKIYNVTPLYTSKSPITGKGQTVVVLEDTDVNSSDVQTTATPRRGMQRSWQECR